MRQRVLTAIGQTCALLVCVGLARLVVAGDLDRYRYELGENKNDKVCRHMEKVYNQNFAFPWKRPMLDRKGTYGSNSPYGFPKLPGVAHDDRKTFDMSFSRLPSSPEFAAIQWKEGRYRFLSLSGIDHGDQPMLVAEFDIDNDGRLDTVVKAGFMGTYYISRGSGGEDRLFVFEKGEIDLNQPIKSEMFYGGRAGTKKAAMITLLPGVPYRLIRPFVYEGVTYLSGYRQDWNEDGRMTRESMHVLRYKGVSANPDPIDRRNIVHLDRICEFSMKVIEQR